MLRLTSACLLATLAEAYRAGGEAEPPLQPWNEAPNEASRPNVDVESRLRSLQLEKHGALMNTSLLSTEARAHDVARLISGGGHAAKEEEEGPECLQVVLSADGGEHPLGKKKCSMTGLPAEGTLGAACYKISFGEGTMMQGCDGGICQAFHNPPGCCTVPGTTQKLMCSDKDFKDPITKNSFASCNNICGSVTHVDEDAVVCTYTQKGVNLGKKECKEEGAYRGKKCLKGLIGDNYFTGCDSGFCANVQDQADGKCCSAGGDKYICSGGDFKEPAKPEDFENCDEPCFG